MCNYVMKTDVGMSDVPNTKSPDQNTHSPSPKPPEENLENTELENTNCGRLQFFLGMIKIIITV